MNRAIRFLLVTVVADVVIAGLFAVTIFAPEPWQDRPWTVWEQCAGYLLPVLGWPLLLIAPPLSLLPDRFTNTFYVLGFILSGACWATIIDVIWNRRKMDQTPNPTSDVIVANRAETSR